MQRLAEVLTLAIQQEVGDREGAGTILNNIGTACYSLGQYQEATDCCQQALICAGAPSVVASLRSVSDESTQMLMERFYTHLQEGMSKAGALRAARMEMIATEEYVRPYHWAAFGATGDPGIDQGASPDLPAKAAPEVTETAAPETTEQEPSKAICPTAVLPLMMALLVGVRRRRSDAKRNCWAK